MREGAASLRETMERRLSTLAGEGNARPGCGSGSRAAATGVLPETPSLRPRLLCPEDCHDVHSQSGPSIPPVGGRASFSPPPLFFSLVPSLAFAKKPKTSATPPPDDTSTTPTPTPTEAKPPEPPPAPEKPAPAADAEKKPGLEGVNIAAAAEEPITYTVEDPNKPYYFVGARSRATWVPKFIENIFVDDGADILSIGSSSSTCARGASR